MYVINYEFFYQYCITSSAFRTSHYMRCVGNMESNKLVRLDCGTGACFVCLRVQFKNIFQTKLKQKLLNVEYYPTWYLLFCLKFFFLVWLVG